MDVYIRRTELFALMVLKRESTVANLASELHVNEKTIRRDLAALKERYLPIETYGGYHGGVRISDEYHPHRNSLPAVLVRALRDAEPHMEEGAALMIEQFIDEYGPYSPV